MGCNCNKNKTATSSKRNVVRATKPITTGKRIIGRRIERRIIR